MYFSDSSFDVNGDATPNVVIAQRWVKNQRPAIANASGDAKVREVAEGLIGGCRLSVEEARALLAEYNARCIPPRPEEELETRLRDAQATFEAEPEGLGWLLEEPDESGGGSDTELHEAIITRLAELWYSTERKPYATVEIRGAKENVPIDKGDFTFWFTGKVLDSLGKVPSQREIEKAIHTAQTLAMQRGQKHKTFVRVAGDPGGTIYIDLCDERRRAVEITANGWRIVTETPVKFLRPPGILPLPDPVEGGSIAEFREFVPVTRQEDFLLIIGFLVMCLCPVGPYTAILVSGRQGTGKSTFTKLFGELIDPHESQLQSVPKDEKDLAIIATNYAIVMLDNLSYISAQTSDTLCKLSTGAAFVTRALWTDSGMSIIRYNRPFVINGIGDIATRGDLIDRGILIELEPIKNRKREKKYWEELYALRPRILGLLYSGVSAAIRTAHTIPEDDLPRMADFARWGMAAGDALGWKPEVFLDAYRSNIANAAVLPLEHTPVGPVIRAFAEANNSWRGSATELLDTLNRAVEFADVARRAKGWPANPSSLSNALSRLAPALAVVGVAVDFGRENGENRNRYVEITYTAPVRSTARVNAGDLLF